MSRSEPLGEVKHLVITSHVEHWTVGEGRERRLHAYGPYAREIEIWADLFDEITIASPRGSGPLPGDVLPIARDNVRLHPVISTGGVTAGAKLRQFFLLPRVATDVGRAMRRADAIHVRCPGNLGLVGAVLAPLFSRYRVAKYAGQWNGYPGQPLTGRLQRYLLASKWWKAPVTVYGEWPAQPPWIHAFFTSMMSEGQVRRAQDASRDKRLEPPLRVLFVGRLDPIKRIDALLEALAILRDRGVDFETRIVGDGPLRETLEQLTLDLGLDVAVRFVGAESFESTQGHYTWAHCLVLPSRSEGWPKVLTEAMCHGVLCIAPRLGQVERMLDQRGVLLEEGTHEEIASSLVQIAEHPAAFRELAQSGASWARQFSLEGLRAALKALLEKEWGVTLKTCDRVAAPPAAAQERARG